jgi:hypothetical protein
LTSGLHAIPFRHCRAIASNQQFHRAEKMSGELVYRQVLDAESFDEEMIEWK